MSTTIGSAAFQPQNELEIELVRAAHEPHLRTAFLRGLIQHEVYLALILAGDGKLEAGPDGRAVIPAGARLEIGDVEREGGRALPFFSAPVRAQVFYRQDHVIAPDKVRDIFARHVGARFVLNPGSDYALDLDQADAAAMLGGDLTAH